MVRMILAGHINDAKTGEFTVDLGQKRRFDVVELKEDIAKGQRISGFKVEVELNGRWVPYGEGSTVGYRRLIQGQPVEAQKIRVTITGAQATPILTNFSVYKTPSSIEKTDGYPLGLDYHQIQQRIKQIQLGMTNLKVSAEHPCGLTKKMQA